MSNDRHLNINDGTMGNLFRRVTLATLGLDSMEGVSEQSFEVIDKADSFVERLLKGVSNVMPKRNVDAMEGKVESLSEHLIEGMSGLNGPKNATDLKEWQYWIDATLLMLFDEDEDAEESLGSGFTHKASRTTYANVNPAQVRQRVEALRKSGVKPSMVQGLPVAAKRSLFESFKQISDVASKKIETSEAGSVSTTPSVSEMIFDKIASLVPNEGANIGQNAGRESFEAVKISGSMDRVFAQNSRQVFASRLAEKAQDISRQIQVADDNHPELQKLQEQWAQSFQAIGSQPWNGQNVRQMLSALDKLVEIGVVDAEKADALRQASRIYARRILLDEIKHDTVAVADGIQKMMSRSTSHEVASKQLISQRALVPAEQYSVEAQNEVFKRSFAMMERHLADLNKAVSSRVLSEGDSAATMRWSRAAERFARLQGVSDEVDRVLLKDVIESASSLENAGIVPRSFVSNLLAMAGQGEKQSETASGFVNSMEIGVAKTLARTQENSEISLVNSSDSAISGRSAMAQMDFANFGMPRVLGKMAEHIESSVAELVEGLAHSGISQSSVDAFVADIHQLVSTGKDTHMSSVALQTVSVIESICSRLDDFAEMTAFDVVSRGYDEIGDSRGTFVSTAEVLEASDKSSKSERAQVRRIQEKMSNAQIQNRAAIEKVQASLEEAKTSAQSQALKLMRSHAEVQAKLDNAEKKLVEAVSTASSVEELVSAQNAIAPHLNREARAELEKTVQLVRRSQAQIATVERQIQTIQNTVKLAQNLRNATASFGADSFASGSAMRGQMIAAIASGINAQLTSSTPVVLGDVRISGDYLSALKGSLSTYAKTRHDYSVGSAFVSGMSDSRIERMLSLVKPIENKLSASSTLTASETELISKIRAELSVGYREIIPDNVQFAQRVSGYPSRNELQNLTQMLGTRKATSLHVADVVGGRPASVQALVSSIQKIVSHPGFASGDTAHKFDTVDLSSMFFDETQELVVARQSSEAIRRIIDKHGGASAVSAMVSASDAEKIERILNLSNPTVAEISEIQKILTSSAHLANSVASSLSSDVDEVMASMSRQVAANRENGMAAVAAEKYLASRDAAQFGDIGAIQHDSDFSSYAVTDSGERVKVSLGLRQSASAMGFGLRQNVGESYMPLQARQSLAENAVAARVSISPMVSSGVVNASSEFVPVSAGAIHQANQVSGNAEAIAEGRTALKSILNRIGSVAVSGLDDNQSERIHLNVDGVDFDMSSSAFVQMVAKPALASASQSMPSLVDANNILFAGYASLLNENGDRRSLNALRHAYVETMARSGAQSVRSEVGFNTQNFADFLGVVSRSSSDSAMVQRSQGFAQAQYQADADADNVLVRAQRRESESLQGYRVGEQFARDMMAQSESVTSSSSEFSPDYSWVSSQVRGNVAQNAYANMQDVHTTHQILGRLDNLLDYVENKSERNVGVFSADETVRVLLESLPQEGKLGNKGLPKWRQKDSRAARISEARELREALAKIGASPVQGTQRFANKQYVSPNLFPEQAGNSAPLFSGGSDGSTSSSSSACASATDSSNSSVNGAISEDVLTELAEEIFHRIEESINEEYQRRRT